MFIDGAYTTQQQAPAERHVRGNIHMSPLRGSGIYCGHTIYKHSTPTKLNLSAEEFEDLEFESVSDNVNEVPRGLPVDKAYLDGFLSARYAEEEDYDPDSPANIARELLGWNKQGKLKTSVSMFGNRYPLEAALKLFGAVSAAGAQTPK